MYQPWHQSRVTDTCNPTVHMTDSCFPQPWGHLGTHPTSVGCRSFMAQADRPAAGYNSGYVRPSSCEYVLNCLLLKVLVPLVVSSKHFTSFNSRNAHKTHIDSVMKGTDCPGLTVLIHLSDTPGCKTQHCLIPKVVFLITSTVSQKNQG